MKLIYKVLFISMLFTAVSCYELDLNDSPNAVSPDRADIEFFYNNVQLEYARFIQQSIDNTAEVVRHRAMFGARYDVAYSPNSFDGMWTRAYAAILPDIESIATTANENGLSTHLGITQIMKAHVLMTLVDLFGDVPYTEALQGTNNILPNADSGKDVYAAAAVLLDEAIGNLSTSGPTVTNELFYGSDSDAWIKVANTLKLKYHLNLRLTDASGSTAAINALIADGNLIDEASEDFAGEYGLTRENPDSRHPWYSSSYEATNGPYMSNYFMWSLLEEKGFEDPRLRYYIYRQDCDTTDENEFTLDCPTQPRPTHYTGPYPWCVASELGWWGRDHGNNDGIPPDGQKRSTYGLYPAGGKFDADDCAHVQNQGVDGARGQGILPILLSSYTHFMLAESALELGTTGDARAYLEEGIRQSFAKVVAFSSRGTVDPAFAIDDTKVDDYVTYVLDAYDSGSDDDKLGVIMKEYHIASWGTAIEMYNGYRRTSHPKGMQPSRDPDQGAFTTSMWYPSVYVDRNANASQKANVAGKVFWDTNPDALQ